MTARLALARTWLALVLAAIAYLACTTPEFRMALGLAALLVVFACLTAWAIITVFLARHR